MVDYFVLWPNYGETRWQESIETENQHQIIYRDIKQKAIHVKPKSDFTSDVNFIGFK